MGRNTSHVTAAAPTGGEDAGLGPLGLCAAEGQRGDEQRDGEAGAGARACAYDGAPADRRSQSPA
jgi:hypothetical protein